MFIVVSPVNKWKTFCYSAKARLLMGAVMLPGLFISCVFLAIKC